MDARSLHRAMTVESLKREGKIIPWPYCDPWGGADVTREQIAEEARRASGMYGAAMRGRLDQFLNEGETQ